ncbi:hypothetical protein AB6A40_007450 [Gnathostoma spinigerum]|uniref:C-factor n=1 Tax=Gnathostoma spinigerum TaxID=75299 RepID=A0ABD6ETG4_9BILA
MMNVPKTVLITGANRGIGLGLVKELMKVNGIEYIFAGFRRKDATDTLYRVAAKNPKLVEPVLMDISNDRSLENSFIRVDSFIGDKSGLNLLINNAGIMQPEGGGVMDADRESYMKHFDTNVVSATMVVKKFLPLLQKGSKSSGSTEMGANRAAIVNISAMVGSITSNTLGSEMFPNLAYRMSKATLNQLTRQLAFDLKKDGIIVTSIDPGWVKTDLGGTDAPTTVDQAAAEMVKAILTLSKTHSGAFIRMNGTKLPF